MGGSCRRADRVPAGQGHGGGQYVRMQGHGQGMRARFGTPSNEELVGSKTPAGGGRAERAEEPTLLHRPVDMGKGGLSTEREQGRVL